LIDEAISRYLRAYGVGAVARDLRVELRHASPASAGEPMQVEARRSDGGEGLNISVYGQDGAVRAHAQVRAAAAVTPPPPQFDIARVTTLEARLAAYEQAHADLHQRLHALETAACQSAIDDVARDAAWRFNDEFAEPAPRFEDRQVRAAAPAPMMDGAPPAQSGFVWRQVRVVEAEAPPPTPPERRYVWRRVRVVDDESPPPRLVESIDQDAAPPPADPGFVWRRVRVVDDAQ
jgi:hypothetical protein